MVIHEENEGPPIELSVIKQPLYENSKYIFVANHIREMPRECPRCALLQDEEARERDFQELKELYEKCKSVMKKIETKYGGYLLIRDDAFSRRRKVLPDSDDEDECSCTVNKKIIYDDDGNEIKVEATLENHICRKKPKMDYINERYEVHDQINVDYNEIELQLPDDLNELAKTLKDPDLSVVHRYKVLDKIRAMRQDYMNDIKFNKQALIEKLKTNPDEVLSFKGTNLSSLPGYS